MPFAIRKQSIPFISLAGLLVAGAVFTGCQSDDAANPDSDALLVLTNPKGGEYFAVGQTIQVQWTTPKTDPNLPVQNIAVRFSADSGKIFRTLNLSDITPADANWKNFSWKIPDSLSFSGLWVKLAGKNNCKLTVETYNVQDPKQKSDTVSFNITAATP